MTNVTIGIITNAIPLNECVERDGYGIIVTEAINGTEITAKVTTCNKQTQNEVVASLNDYDLETDIIDETAPYLLITPSTIQLDVSTISDPWSTEFESTLMDNTPATTDKKDISGQGNENGLDNVVIMIIVIVSSLGIIVCMVIVCVFKFRRNLEQQLYSVLRDDEDKFMGYSPPIIDDSGVKQNGMNINVDKMEMESNVDLNNIMTPGEESALKLVKMAFDDDP